MFKIAFIKHICSKINECIFNTNTHKSLSSPIEYRHGCDLFLQRKFSAIYKPAGSLSTPISQESVWLCCALPVSPEFIGVLILLPYGTKRLQPFISLSPDGSNCFSSFLIVLVIGITFILCWSFYIFRT